MIPVLPQRLNSIQALRGIAAILVLFFHIAEFQRQMAGPNSLDLSLLEGFWNQGWAGVDLFFVISGFIMVYVTQKYGRSMTDIKSFLWARITRIYPLWWVCCSILALYFYVTYGLVEAPDRVTSSREAWIYFGKSLLLVPQENLPLLNLGWTLIHEIFFYLVFAGILCAPRQLLPRLLILWAALTLIGYLFLSSHFSMGPISQLLISPLSLEFICGAFIGYLILNHQIKSPKLIIWLGATLTILTLFLFPYLTLNDETLSRVIIYALPMSALVYGAAGLDINGSSRIPSVFIHLGNWSYSIYLTHYISLSALRRFYKHYMPDSFLIGSSGIWDNILFVIIAIVLSIFVASLSYRFIERPSLIFFRRIKVKE